jgi:hypothetical protein
MWQRIVVQEAQNPLEPIAQPQGLLGHHGLRDGSKVLEMTAQQRMLASEQPLDGPRLWCSCV